MSKTPHHSEQEGDLLKIIRGSLQEGGVSSSAASWPDIKPGFKLEDTDMNCAAIKRALRIRK